MIFKTYKKDKNLNNFIINIQQHFKDSTNSIHKARNEIKILNFNNKELVIKAFKVPHILNKIVYSLFRDSKAKRSYDYSIKINKFVPKPIAYIEFKKFGLFSKSYFISERFKYDFTLREPLNQKEFFDRNSLFKEFIKFTIQLHEEGIYHLDYSPGNILIKREENQYIFKIVDINRMQFKTLTLEDRLKNFSKLWATDEDMHLLIKEYAKAIHENEEYCISKAIEYSQQNKNFRNLKKRLKGKKIVK